MIESNFICSALTKKYTSDKWKIFFELRDSTGFSSKQNRYLDAWAINLYPSEGLQRIAFEIKVSRTDFLNELKNPGKREFGLSVSNEFYFIVPSGLVKDFEVPENIGLMFVNEEGEIRTTKKATYREVEKMVPLSFLASICRRENTEPMLLRNVVKFCDKEVSLKDIDEFITKEIESGSPTIMVRRINERAQELVQKELDKYAVDKKFVNQIIHSVTYDIFSRWGSRISDPLTQEDMDKIKGYFEILKNIKNVINNFDNIRQNVNIMGRDLESILSKREKKEGTE